MDSTVRTIPWDYYVSVKAAGLPLPPLPARVCPIDFLGYAVTPDGHVLSCLTSRGTFAHHWKRRKTHIVGRRVKYEQITVIRHKRPYVTTVHRLMLLTFRGPCPPDYESRHLNGHSTDNRLDNLQWGTRQQNSDDKELHGTQVHGAKNGQAKLTPAQVASIRALRPMITLCALARRFSVSRSQVKRIVYGKSWR